MKIEIGARRKLTHDVPATCCNYILPSGRTYEIYKQPTPNRLIVSEYPPGPSWGYHKVKRSTFMSSSVPVGAMEDQVNGRR